MERNSGYNYILSLTEAVTLFSKLSSLYSSGIPLSESLTTISQGISTKKIKSALTNANIKLNSGQTLAEALYCEGLLNPLYYNLITLGEHTGTLDLILKNIIKDSEERLALYRNIISKLTYPAIMILTSILIIPLPEAFKENGSYFKSSIIPLILLFFLIGSAYSLFIRFRHDQRIRQVFDSIIIKIPYIGQLIEDIAWIRFCTVCSICIGSGLDIISTAELSRKSFNNKYLESQTINIKRAMTFGKELTAFLTETTSVPSIVIELAAIGEKTGTLEQSMSKAATQLKEKLTHHLSVLNIILPIVISLIIAAYLGYTIIKFYMNYLSTLSSY